MKPLLSSAWIGSAVVALVLTTTGAAAAQDNDITAARELYASAAYEDALAMLNRLRSSDRPASQSRVIEQYRAFCLLALGRPNDAEQAIEAVVAADPLYHPGENEVSPRIRSTFADVRRRMLPTIVQQKYAVAKAEFDHKDYAAAARDFSQLLVTLADPDLAAEAAKPPLADMRQLAVGFQELSAKAAAPPPAPAPAPTPTPAPPPAPVVQAPPPPPATMPAHIYTAEDRTVVPPMVINQSLPGFRGVMPVERIGRLEVVIDETGAVESAVMTASVNNVYDKAALTAARTWKYTPATVNGKPVKFRKLVQITVKPTT
ncbi:MAG TPA: TonB family protein [Vicinamibacterales bacterium]|nr:TonB family protein [Vicinamibacterales bacterium]